MEVVAFLAAAVAFGAWMVHLHRRDGQAHRSFASGLAARGFRRCDPGESKELEDRLAWLQQRGWRYELDREHVGALGGQPAWFFRRTDDLPARAMGRDACAEEFLIRLRRPSETGLLLFLQPPRAAGTALARIGGALQTLGSDTLPRDLERLALPEGRARQSLVAAMGAPGTRLLDHLTPAQLSLLEHAAEHGVTGVACRGEWCALGSAHAWSPIDLGGLWPLLQQLVASEA